MDLVVLKDVGSHMMRARGFTLIELLVTIAVAIILATVAVPGFQRMIAINRVAADYNEVLTGLNFARSEAVKRRAPVQFVASNNGSWEYVVSIVGGSDLRSRRGRDDRTVVSAGNVTFNALGRRENCTASNNCVFTVSLSPEVSGVDDKGVQVSLMGRVGQADNLVAEEEAEE